MAPNFELRDLSGNQVRLDSFRGHPVLIDFWATWCGPCRFEIPGYIELQKKYGDAGLAIVGVSLDRGGPLVVKKFVEEQKINYLIVLGDDKVAEAFGGVEAIPTTFIIDRGGTARFRKEGAMDHEEFEAILKPFLKQ